MIRIRLYQLSIWLRLMREGTPEDGPETSWVVSVKAGTVYEALYLALPVVLLLLSFLHRRYLIHSGGKECGKTFYRILIRLFALYAVFGAVGIGPYFSFYPTSSISFDFLEYLFAGFYRAILLLMVWTGNKLAEKTAGKT